MGTGIKIALDGTLTDLDKADYEGIRKAIGGGWLEAVTMPDGAVLYMDEEGKMKGFQLNEVATKLARGTIFDDDHISGPAVLVGSVNGDGDHDDLTELQRKRLQSKV